MTGMSTRYGTSDGQWTVEIVELSCTPNNRDGQWYRVRHCGFHVADVRTVAELERHIPLAELNIADMALEMQRLLRKVASQHASRVRRQPGLRCRLVRRRGARVRHLLCSLGAPQANLDPPGNGRLIRPGRDTQVRDAPAPLLVKAT